MTKKISKRQQQYLANKEAKTGTEIICPICKDKFIKRQYSQAFCCSQCKDAYWNAKNSDRHSNPDYYRNYNHKSPNKTERLAYAKENCRILIGNGYDKHQFDYLYDLHKDEIDRQLEEMYDFD